MKRKNKIDAVPAETAPAEEQSVQIPADEAEKAQDAAAEAVEDASSEVVEEVVEETPAEAVKTEKTPSAFASVIKITLPLSIICIVVALMLAAVNALTADTIAANASKEKEAAILSLFPEGESMDMQYAADGTEIYRVKTGDDVIGYCADVEENGFGGAISMMVGVDPTGSVCGVKIVSLSETPGIGSKVKSDGFLNRFRGRDPFVIGENFDAISGATISSKAVVRAVNRARAAVADKFDFEEAPAEDVQMQLPAETPVPEVSVPAESAPTPEETQVISVETSSAAEAPRTNLALFLPAGSISAKSKTVNRVSLSGAETVVIDERPAPVETAPAETEAVPAETTAPETLPAESAPAETEAAETIPAETTPAETTPAETAPAVL